MTLGSLSKILSTEPPRLLLYKVAQPKPPGMLDPVAICCHWKNVSFYCHTDVSCLSLCCHLYPILLPLTSGPGGSLLAFPNSTGPSVLSTHLNFLPTFLSGMRQISFDASSITVSKMPHLFFYVHAPGVLPSTSSNFSEYFFQINNMLFPKDIWVKK